jgi:2-amino-4-hydroxy-6-hydroxymethyldihydropteridine diphosphokinase
MNKFIVAAGSSHHEAFYYLEQAERRISRYQNIKICAKSRVFKNCSKFSSINRLFFNQAFALETYLEPLVFYRELRSIESFSGRIRSYKNAPRTLDLDILLLSNLKYKSSNFRVPHAQTFLRSFFVVCAQEALMRARWPIPVELALAATRGGRDYLVACS